MTVGPLVVAALLGSWPAGPSSLPAPPDAAGIRPAGGACSVLLAALDASGETIFRTVALALDRPGLVATPLHTLERGGVRWERLVIETGSAGSHVQVAEVATVVSFEPSADLAYLHAPGIPACAPETGEGAEVAVDATAPILVLRERSGYRPAAVGGRVERTVELPDGRRLILARLLDTAGADPGIALDGGRRLIGSLAPAPPGCDPALAAIVLSTLSPAGFFPAEGPPRAPRAILGSGASSFQGTPAGQAAQALLLGGSGRFEEALGRLDDLIGRGGASAPMLLERGVLCYASGRLEAAVTDFTLASEVDPRSYLAHFNLGISLGVGGRYDDAAAALRRARDLAPENPRARFELALALRASHHADAAKGEWQSLDRLDPTMAKELRILLGF